MLSQSDGQESCLPEANGSDFNHHHHRKRIIHQLHTKSEKTDAGRFRVEGGESTGTFSLRWGRLLMPSSVSHL